MTDFKAILSSANLKVTNARLAVLSFLEEIQKPVDVDEIFSHLKEEHDGIDLVTVYRILDSFYQKGLVKRIDFQEKKFRYELAGNEHHHLVCEQCGRIDDISDCNISELQQEIAKKKNFKINRHSLEFYGVCKLCQH